jgi:2-polyprenyl-3-methyl-5-hydroxy-6-metoxy-1,4-benzoquinol methylase
MTSALGGRGGPACEPVAACPLCECTASRLLFESPDRLYGTPGNFAYRRCTSCRTVYQSPRVTASALPGCYPSNYSTRAQQVRPRRDGFGSRIRVAMTAALQGSRTSQDTAGVLGRLLARCPAARRRAFTLIDVLLPRDASRRRALDVGCGGGTLMLRLARAGWDVDGVDWDASAAETARHVSDRPVAVGDFRAVRLPLSEYDLVVMSHVIEHLDDPAGALRRVKDLLKPGGRAVLLYPNPDSLGARLFGAYWVNWDPPRHLVIPPARPLCQAALAVGFARAVSSAGAQNRVLDFARSRACLGGRTLDLLRSPHIGVPDRLLSLAEAVVGAIGAAVGEESVVVLFKGE